MPGPSSLTISQGLPKFISIVSVMPSSHLTLCCPLLLLPSIFPNITVFSNESLGSPKGAGKKKRTSEMMNRTIPYQSPFRSVGVWWPWEVLSQMMSCYHWYIMRTLVSRLSSNNTVELKWNHITRPDVIKRAERTPVRGQGLGFNMHMIGVGLVKEMATHSSVLAWRIPGTGEPGGLPSMGSHRVGHNWSDLAAAAAACIVM